MDTLIYKKEFRKIIKYNNITRAMSLVWATGWVSVGLYAFFNNSYKLTELIIMLGISAIIITGVIMSWIKKFAGELLKMNTIKKPVN